VNGQVLYLWVGGIEGAWKKKNWTRRPEGHRGPSLPSAKNERISGAKKSHDSEGAMREA